MSKFHKIDCQNKIIVHKVANKDSHVHNGEVDEGRLIYCETNKRFYIGDVNSWNMLSTSYDVFDQGTKVLMGYYPLPTGWNLDTSFNDRLALLDNNESNIGNTGGSWTISGMYSDGQHTHSSSTASIGTASSSATNKVKNSSLHLHRHIASADGYHDHTFDGTWRPYYKTYCVAEYQ